MILRVKLEDFANAARRYANAEEAFLAEVPGGVSITAVDIANDVMVLARSEDGMDATREALAGTGLALMEGHWSSDEDEPEDSTALLYVAAVAYRSRDAVPGLWMDAYPSQPTTADVIQAIYKEFVATGEMAEVGVEEFQRLAQPNVCIMSPTQMKGFAMNKEPEE